VEGAGSRTRKLREGELKVYQYKLFAAGWVIVLFVAIATMLGCLRSGDAEAGQAGFIVGGPFTLVDHTGATVTDETYRGKWLVMFFGFTHCPDICPMTLSKIASMMEFLGQDAQKVQPLFITVDPERDTVEVLRDYVAAFDRRIVGLTGSAEQIATVAKNYDVISQRSGDGANYSIGHSTPIYLVDPSGIYISILDPDISPQDMAKWLRALM
jgi:protein SCO1/2